MGCCGKSRTMTSTHAAPVVSAVPAAPRPKPAAPSESSFQYIGARNLTVEGPASKRRYWFAAPDAIVAVDERDAPSLARVPLLRRV